MVWVMCKCLFTVIVQSTGSRFSNGMFAPTGGGGTRPHHPRISEEITMIHVILMTPHPSKYKGSRIQSYTILVAYIWIYG